MLVQGVAAKERNEYIFKVLYMRYYATLKAREMYKPQGNQKHSH